ncbi:thiamine pyrophosphate-dependent enzyme [Kribbella sp. NPDC056345]|uniref:thiamine pyrophosphate-dependent enzyme n=1 Tax=Kribbella sp. NPDC056345 TaxID=3345789 RepID=UPI0035DE4828
MPEHRAAAPVGGRATALAAVLAQLPDHLPVVYANGYIAREGMRERPEGAAFPMLGSMGLAGSIGLGLALGSRRPSVVVDGDGNALMGASALPVIGKAAADAHCDLLHIVLDDGVYASTGRQQTLAAHVDWLGLATACGYRASQPRTVAELEEATRSWLARGGLGFLHIVVDSAGESPAPRVPRTPPEIARRLTDQITRSTP